MTDLHVEHHGTQGTRVALVHGSLSSGGIAWSEQLTLASRWQLLIIDRRGYGASPARPAVVVEEDADDILSVLGETPAHLVATSMGGLSAIAAAVQRPDLVRSLTLIEPPLLARYASLDEVVLLAARLRDAYEKTADLGIVDFLKAFLDAVGVEMPLPEPLPNALMRAAAMARTERPWLVSAPVDALAKASFPKLVISGTESEAFPTICTALAGEVGAVHLKFAGAPHAVQRIGAPFNDALAEFLTNADQEVRL